MMQSLEDGELGGEGFSCFTTILGYLEKPSSKPLVFIRAVGRVLIKSERKH